MLQQDAADDYVLGTGESHSIKEFVDVAARYAGFELEWEGSDVKEIAVDRLRSTVCAVTAPKQDRSLGGHRQSPLKS